ncbi:Aste57867_16438 [Aphanomyces stellatus]|uniref:Aste57867_16438 protein n=1 Tax=Aphanomyces stellatus TaxID=120398 RepID=A0A485L695_9STRA|nr:hypothetical protein As57867_016381 [Aphanomyces stellatus]VFT93213.1 Aste57867_16438 [Aphanomyces stellatus]
MSESGRSSPQPMADDDFEALLREPSVPAPHTDDDHHIIDDLQDAKTTIRAYVDDFDGLVPAAEVIVAAISKDIVQQQEAELERRRIQKAMDEAKEYQMRESHLAYKEAKARARLDDEAAAQKQKLAAKELQSLQVVSFQSKKLLHVYHQAESHMKNVLARQQAHVRDTYGHVETKSPAHAKRYRAEWIYIPQPIEIKLHMLRALKDKLPQGHYVILATLYDRLGGSPMSWSVAGDRGIGAEYPGLTTPLLHGGHFYNTELVVDQNIYVVCPSQSELRPANVVVFEIYMLSGQSATKDAVVGWGVLPVCNADFEVVAGRFKVPLLRGDVDHTLTKFHDFEHMYLTDLSSWLCNMYVTVRHLPRERLDTNGVLEREYDVELDFMNQLLKLETKDRALLASYQDDLTTQRRKRQVAHPLSVSSGVAWGKDAAAMSTKAKARQRKLPAKGSKRGGKVAPTQGDTPDGDVDVDASPPNDEDPKVHSTPPRAGWRHWFRRRHRRPRPTTTPRLTDDETATTTLLSGHLAESMDAAHRRQRRLLDRQADEVHLDDDDDDTTPSGAPAPAQTWEGFTFATNQYIGDTEVAKHTRFQTARKLRYLKQELFADMGLNKAATMQFWLMVAFFALALWLRLYVHYLGQWLYLRAANVPVFDFRPQLLTCVLKYTWNTIPSATEIGVIVLGVLVNVLTFGGFMGIAYLCQRFIGEFPDIASRFIACFGLGTVLDPFLVFLVDVVQHNYSCSALTECKDPSATACNCAEGDAFKLYARYLATDGSGVVGVVLTLLIYGILLCFSAAVFYTYLLHFHMNGRMLDVYRRVHAREGLFFVPNDFEVSGADVTALCEKAARWKSIKGTQRKTAVCEYELRDPADPTFVETTVHIAIFNLELDGARQLYRHFIKNPDGEMLEVFGTISESLGSQYAALESALFQTAPPDDITHTGMFDAL